ncbi:MAG: cysteine--tRNA ligase [SAR86 cluster bacterium]|nr:cysteine--tRNA ligase [SAR86 cluster bacterium]
MKIYNSLNGQKEEFVPIKKGSIDMYICGMTVYDDCHLGHARTFLAFDMIVRYLRYKCFKVNYVRNITDVDDNILDKAILENINPEALTEKFILSMQEDFISLGMIKPDSEPRATHHIEEIINLISDLISKKFAYFEGGDVYFAVDSFPEYGKLSKRNLDDLMVGSRVEINQNKRNPSDFVLWKKDKNDSLKWDSPWGEGRPGWHIECSAMSMKSFGDSFDIHGGGSDLKFPHHENEIAQSESSTGKSFANFWMHTGPLRIDDKKMSKSLGNFFTIRSVLESYKPEVIRFFLLSSHYRSPLNYSSVKLDEANSALERLYGSIRDIEPLENERSEYTRRFHLAMDDDFNTPEAIAIFFDIARQINIYKPSNMKLAQTLAGELIKLAEPLGLLTLDPEIFYKDIKNNINITEEEILDLIDKRNEARENKNFKEADQIRLDLDSKGILLDDTQDRTSWKKK